EPHVPPLGLPLPPCHHLCFFFFPLLPPPPPPTLFPYTTLFRSYRHPVDTLNFFGVKPGNTVVEIWPGGGWYTEILAPLTRAKGRSEEHTSELQSRRDLVCRLLLEKKKTNSGARLRPGTTKPATS